MREESNIECLKIAAQLASESVKAGSAKPMADTFRECHAVVFERYVIASQIDLNPDPPH